MKHPLIEKFQALGQGAVGSVQNGDSLNNRERYMHVKRPVEDTLYDKMRQVKKQGKGLVLLMGSAGDGKSHLISCIRKSNEFKDFVFYNDATVSFSPDAKASETLKQVLADFSDENIQWTSKKMLLAINLGKLNEFIEDSEVQDHYQTLINLVSPVFEENGFNIIKDIDEIKVVQFTNHQIYKIFKNDSSQYPIDSSFLKQILQKITEESNENPFYVAYMESRLVASNHLDPIILNYELLRIPAIQDAIVKMIIESVIRFQLMITPRDFFDMIYRIVVYKNYEHFNANEHFFEALLPTLIFNGGDNRILNNIYSLDPLKYSCNSHDDELAVLFTARQFPSTYFNEEIQKKIPVQVIDYVNSFYRNNGKDIERISAFLFRLKHLLSYHSECHAYKDFLHILLKFYNNDKNSMITTYRLVDNAIVRHYGAYYEKKDRVPLNIQGSTYKLFAGISKKMALPVVFYQNENEFYPFIQLQWNVGKNKDSVSLKLDYDLYEYLIDLSHGMLNLNYENDKSLEFNRFIRQLIKYSNCEEEVYILDDNNNEHLLSTQIGSIIYN